MGLLDFILNLAGLLLWVNWRIAGAASLPRQASVSLVNTLQAVATTRTIRWRVLFPLGLILILRPFLYRYLGGPLRWSPVLDLTAVQVSFRSDQLGRMFAFSFLGFAQYLGILYSWLLFLGALNRKSPEAEAGGHQVVRACLGFLDRFPWPVKLLLVPLGAGLFWAILGPILGLVGVAPRTTSGILLWQQCLVYAGCGILSWRTPIILFLILHTANTYIYFGGHLFWKYAEATGRRLLRPFAWLPLSFNRFDLVPFLVTPLIWFAAWWMARGLAYLYNRLPM